MTAQTMIVIAGVLCFFGVFAAAVGYANIVAGAKAELPK